MCRGGMGNIFAEDEADEDDMYGCGEGGHAGRRWIEADDFLW